jgi:hypothetical protein
LKKNGNENFEYEKKGKLLEKDVEKWGERDDIV